MTLPFSDEEYSERLKRVQARIRAAEVEALVVTTPPNLTYLTGYETQGLWFFNGLVVAQEGDPIMVVRAAENTVVEAESTIRESRTFWDSEDPMLTLTKVLSELGLENAGVGFEQDSYFFRNSELARLETLRGVGLVPQLGVVESERLVKSPREIEVMRSAAKATDAGVLAGVAAVAEGASENDVASAVYAGLLGAGSHYTALQPFVVSGPRAFLSHATWRSRKLASGDCVFMEIGGCVNRYHAAAMRSVSVGPKSDRLAEAEELVLEATDVAMEAIKPGALTSVPDREARAVISRNTFGAEQYTRVGYGIGLTGPPGWGEGHMIDIKDGNDQVFEAGMTFHLIPFLQIPNEAAVGISETVLVTESGCERLTQTDRCVFEA